MTTPTITEEDVAALETLVPDLDFKDAERKAVLLENASQDVNAAPGSGKTTLLAAKLLLLARKWPHERRGICVLSHTNVAKEEIGRRLEANVDGARLLSHPHFIGTIHSFVDRFLALPTLRSAGVSVDVIDDDAFAKRAIAMAERNFTLKAWAKNNLGVMPIVGGLVYRGAGLTLSSDGGKLPGETSKSYAALESIKARLFKQGVFRYDDMFAFAEYRLKESPELKTRLSNRFPIVFIDEMQDTSLEQEELLAKLFDETVILQRFGDVNQRIIGAYDKRLTFPKAGALPIRTSKRFGPAIASAVSSVRTGGEPVVGSRDDTHQPMLLLYSTGRVGEVIHTFGQAVLHRFHDAALDHGPVRALCTRKQGNANQEPGRTLLDYWPAFQEQAKNAWPASDRFWALLMRKSAIGPMGLGLAVRAAEIKRAILLVLRSAASPHVSEVRDGGQLMRALRESGIDLTDIRHLCREVVLATELAATAEARALVPEMFFVPLQTLLGGGMSLEEFRALSVFELPNQQPVIQQSSHVCVVEQGNRRVCIDIGTVASMKGETHLATLVLESLGHPSRKFDLEEALPILGGLTTPNPKWNDGVLSQFRNLYVGMSRPTSFLCLAANSSRVSADCEKALVQLGWTVERIQ